MRVSTMMTKQQGQKTRQDRTNDKIERQTHKLTDNMVLTDDKIDRQKGVKSV